MDRDPLTAATTAGPGIGLKIGLTGGIGSGKSTVAKRFAAFGACVVDADALSRSLTAPGGAAIPAIAAAFGDAMLTADGALDRTRMRELVFARPDERLRLEGILHPLIGRLTHDAAASAAPGQAVVFDVPLLTESASWRARVDRILIVDCSPATQVARVVQRSGWTVEAVERAIAQQATRAQRRAIADAVIVNDGLSLVGLDAAVDAVWQAWRARGDAAS